VPPGWTIPPASGEGAVGAWSAGLPASVISAIPRPRTGSSPPWMTAAETRPFTRQMVAAWQPPDLALLRVWSTPATSL